MKISTNYVRYSIATLMSGFCVFLGYRAQQDSKKYEGIDDIKKEIMQKDPKRYELLINRPLGEIPCSYKEWNLERKIMNDSIKSDSLIQRAYFEGAQMVRDSINNAKKGD